MSLIGKKIEEFNAHAYHQGEFFQNSVKKRSYGELEYSLLLSS